MGVSSESALIIYKLRSVFNNLGCRKNFPQEISVRTGMPGTFRRKFPSYRGCFLRWEACRKDSVESFCHAAVASLYARLLPWMRGMSERCGGKSLSCRGCFLTYLAVGNIARKVCVLPEM